MNIVGIKNNFLNFAKRFYIKYCLYTRNINLRHVPKFSEKTSKRILFIASDNNRSSGAFLCLVSLCDFLINKHNLDVFVVLPYHGNGRRLLDDKKIPNCVINSFGWGIELSRERDSKCLKEISDKKLINNSAIERLRKLIEINNVDLIHINSSYSYIGAIAALKENIPFVWHIRELLEEGQNNTMWDRKKGNDLINKSTKVIAISDSVKEKYSKWIDVDKLITIYDGVEIDKFYNPDKEIFNENIVRIIFIGNIAKYKGIYEFTQACIRLYEKGFKNIKIYIVGSGETEVLNDIKKAFDNVGVSNVNFTGYQKDVSKFLDKSDIFCMCTKWEAFGRTTVEAMLSGNLVIGANTAGTKDLIDDGLTGFLYNQGDSEDLCNKMILAIENKSKSKEIARLGREYMFENMSSEKNADEIYKLYNDILNE